MLSRKTGILEKLIFEKKIPDTEWKTFGRFKNCFRCMQQNMLRKKRFTSKRYSVCTNLGLWTKNTRQVCQTFTRGFQSNIFEKKMFSGRNIVYLNLGLRLKISRPGCQTCFLYDDEKKLKRCFFKKPHSHAFSTFLEWKTFHRIENRNLLVQKNVLGLFNWQKNFYHHSPSLTKKHVRDLVKRFQHGFQCWIQGVQENILMHKIFWKSQTFFINSGFWAITYCNFWQHEFQHASQKCILRFQRNFLKENLFWTNVNMWSVTKIKRNSFGRIIKTAFYISSGQLWRKVHFLGKIIFKLMPSHFKWYFIGTLTTEIGRAVKWAYLASGQKCWGKSGFLEKNSKFSSFLNFEQKTTGKNVKPAFQLSSEAIRRNLKFLKDLWINIIFALRVKNKRRNCQKCILSVRWKISSEKLLWTIHTFAIFFRI